MFVAHLLQLYIALITRHLYSNDRLRPDKLTSNGAGQDPRRIPHWWRLPGPLLRVVRHFTAGLACSFHRCSFTPITRSQSITDSCPRMPRALEYSLGIIPT